MKSQRASILAASTLLFGVIGLAASAAGGKAPAPAARPAPTPAPAPAPAKGPTNTPNNSTTGDPNNHYQRNPAPYGYGDGYGYGYGDGNSGNTTGTKTNTPSNNNQPNPAPSPSNSPSASSDSGGSGRNSPATQPASTPVDPEVAAATAELNTAMANLRATLSAQPDYAAALDEKQRASADAAAFHEKGDTGAGDISEIAARGLKASKTLSQIERTAMANDPAVIKAKAHLKEALAGQGTSAKSS